MIAVAKEKSVNSELQKNSTQHYLAECVKSWQSSSKHIPETFTIYTAEQQQKNDKKCAKVLEKTTLRSNGDGAKERWGLRARMQRKRYHNLLQTVLGFSAPETRLIMQADCGEATTTFIRKVKQFDASLSSKDIYQACRNVWMLNALQMMLGQKVETSPSVFAYSLLYPYTDNFLDDPTISRHEKRSYFNAFKKRLEGKPVFAENAYQNQLYKLIACIEGQYPREQFPEVYQSMLWIHQAQQESIVLLKNEHEPDQAQVRDIVFQKGGTSVLTDGYLVVGRLTDRQAEACYYFGVILQLLDDLQDIAEDRNAGLKTIYSFADNSDNQETLLNQTLNFVAELRKYTADFPGDNASHIIDVIVKSCHIYMINNVCKYPELYSSRFCEKMEKRIPVKMTRTNLKRKELIYNYIDSL